VEDLKPVCVVKSPSDCPLVSFAEKTGTLSPEDARAWTLYIRYGELLEKGMWSLVEHSLPEMTNAERGRLADSLATIMNLFSRRREEKNREAIRRMEQRGGR